jgi:2'-5' RNA ligase
MSTRYAVSLLTDPDFTARAYRARQLICGQYACWAAEMHMLRMTLVPYFECPEDGLPKLDSELARIVEQRRHLLCIVRWAGISSDKDTGSIFLDLDDLGEALSHLQRAASGGVRRIAGARVPSQTFHPRIALLEFGGLPPAILEDAAEYARVVAADLAVHATASPWRLLVLRYSSDAASDDWSNGRWAADVSWKQLFSYAL